MSVALVFPGQGSQRAVDAREVSTGAACREALILQVSAPVRWQESVERLAGLGVDTFVEVGPGTVLSGLVKKIVRGARVRNVEDPASLGATLAALQGAGSGAA